MDGWMVEKEEETIVAAYIASLLYIQLYHQITFLFHLSLDLLKVYVHACAFLLAYLFLITKPNALCCLKVAYSVRSRGLSMVQQVQFCLSTLPSFSLTQPGCSELKHALSSTCTDSVLFLLFIPSGWNPFSKQCLPIEILPMLGSSFLSPDHSLQT